MAERVTPQQLMSVEEYLEFERNSPVKHEYVGGHVYAMVGVSRRHSRISGNIFRKLRSLRAYLIVEQDEARVERHYRDEQDEWRTAFVEEGVIPVPCPPNAKLSLADIYAGL